MNFIFSLEYDDKAIRINYINIKNMKKESCTIMQLRTKYNNFYGVRIRNNTIDYFGYNHIPTYRNNKWSYGNSYTIIGKCIKNSSKYYLLVRANGALVKLDEQHTIGLIHNNQVTNTIKSNRVIKLKTGSILDMTNNINTKKPSKDYSTIEKISDDIFEKLIGSPGVGEKFIGYNLATHKFGVAKHSISTDNYDNINEVLAKSLGNLFSIKVCNASLETYQGDKNWVLSYFEYGFKKSNIKSCKSIFGTTNFSKRFNIEALKDKFGQSVVDDFNRMVIFDCLTFQEDRHISNFAFLGQEFYPLYDNGRCLFWDKSTEYIKSINIDDILLYVKTNEHGYGFNYIDGILGIDECRRLIANNVDEKSIYNKVRTYYKDEDRAKILSKFIYRIYVIVMGYKL